MEEGLEGLAEDFAVGLSVSGISLHDDGCGNTQKERKRDSPSQ